MIARGLGLVLLLVGIAQTTPGTTIHYRLANAGLVSLAVYDVHGTMVREVLRADPQAAGEHAVRWDGRDRDERPLPPGSYDWKLLETQGLRAEYLLSVGSNYPVGTDLSSSGGPGSHVTPFAVAADATGVYVGAFQTENIETALVKLSPDGRTRLWSQRLPSDDQGRLIAWEGARALTSDQGELYLLGHRYPQRVHVSDVETGAPRRAFTVDWEPPMPYQVGAEAHGGAVGMAVGHGVVVVAYESRDALCWFDARTGALLATAHVPSPSAVAMGEGEVVFATTGDRVVRLSRASPVPATVRSDLTRPGPLVIEPATGDLLVFEGGSQQVLRISSRGEVLHRYGAAGGRQDGRYVPTDFRNVTALAVDGAGGFLVAEPYAAPRRVAQFDRDGELLREWYGGQPWDTSAALEPGRPEAIWIPSAEALDGSRYVMRVLVDYAHRTWRVHSCYRYLSPDNPLMRDSGNEGRLLHVYRHAGSNYLAAESELSIWRIDEARWRLVPATAVGKDFQWNDANGDGLVQENEKSPHHRAIWRNYQVPHLAENFDLFFVSDASESCRIRRSVVTSWTAAGAPVYGVPDGEPYADCPSRFSQHRPNDGRWSNFLYFDAPAQSLFGAFNPGTTDWCSSRDSFVQAWDPAGQPTWQVGRQGPAPKTNRVDRYTPTPAGLVYWNLRGIAGTAHGCFVAFDVDGGWTSERAQTYVWDRDGLFVGGLMDRPKLDGVPEFLYHLGGEMAHGSLATTSTGDVIFAGNWENEVRLYRISGWDEPARPWVHASGRVTLP